MLKHYIISLSVLCASVYSQTAAVPFGKNDTYKHGLIQNYQTSNDADATAQSWYNYWKTSFTKDCGDGKIMAINDYGSSNAYSEGQGYGMLLAAYVGDRTLFDGLLKGYIFAKNQNGVMNWTASCTNKSIAANGATDGDLDAAMAMVVAHKQWPTAGYGAEATKSINAIKATMFTECNGKIVQKPGDMFGGCDCTNPSYYATGYYRAFGVHNKSDAAWWNRAADDGIALLLTATHPSTGLNPAWTDASGSITSGGNCNVAAPGGGARYDYQFDAARTPWRMVVDYLWWGTPKAQQYLSKITTWAKGKGINNIYAGHKLDGTAYLNYTNSAFVGGFAIGAMGTTDQTAVNDFQKWWVNNSMVDQNWNSGKKLDDKPYFQNSLRVLYYFVASGNFWNPVVDIPTSEVTVNITAPTTTDFNTGNPISVSATATTASGNITKVEFLVDGKVVNTVTSAPFNYTVNGLTAGAHEIEVRATDSNGKTGSKIITVNILLGIPKISTPPVIDGDIDAIWEHPSVTAITLGKTIQGTLSGTADLSGTFKAVWDNTYLYVLGNVNDDSKVNDSPETYNDDAVEVYVDINNDKATTYGANDVQYTFGWDDNTPVAGPSGRSTTNVTFVNKAKTGGYIFEARIPWTTLQGNPAVGQKLGIDFMVNDDDDNSTRDSKISWNAATDNAWENPSLIGSVTLGDLITGITDVEVANISMYPNPFNNSFRIDNLEQVEFVEVLDAHGKTMETLAAGTSSIELGNNYAKGLYFVKLKYANKSTSFKMIKQ